jgi:hypothetical protein
LSFPNAPVGIQVLAGNLLWANLQSHASWAKQNPGVKKWQLPQLIEKLHDIAKSSFLEFFSISFLRWKLKVIQLIPGPNP